MTFKELKRNIKKDYTGFKEMKIAVLGDSPTQLLAQAIKGAGYNQQLNFNVFDADYNQVDRLTLDITSELYNNKAAYTIIFESAQKLLEHYNKTTDQERTNFADNQLKRIEKMARSVQSSSDTKIIYFNYAELDDQVFGNYSNKVESSFPFQQRKLNYLIMEYSVKNPAFNICDISSIQNRLGRELLFSPSIYINTDSVLSIEALPVVAECLAQMISVIEGQVKKCLIVDLDNTIWGGVIGDDGMDHIKIGSLGIGKAFTELQYWIKKLKQRGIIICVCSKNTESIAKEPFEKHPDMVLRLEDFSVFKANWENKVDNIKAIQQILNIGFDSMVFIDDNPFERGMVSEAIPNITVPKLPEDPAEYLSYLYSLNLFETASYSDEDAMRTEQYNIRAKATEEMETFDNENDFLKNLKMLSNVQDFNSFSIPRVAQLSQRSNQFNLRTIRYTEEDIRNIVESSKFKTFFFTLEDKYGDNGIISAIILEKLNGNELFIDTWFMSCRVIKRGMEKFVLNTIVTYARENGYEKIVGEYIPTAKNDLVKEHYKGFGFEEINGLWELAVAKFVDKETFINMKER